MADEGDESEVGQYVAEDYGEEAHARVGGGEGPLLEDGRETLEEGEDEGVAEAREKGEEKHDWLGEEHVERPNEEFCELCGW